ncbi:MAG: phosphotransferase [Acidimicrobiales bacterium]|nr:phosphotransferase [Acidimicrobiales bacterium]MCB9395862.1 phosphotransferase [Acidimicrobiaceae bacterium]
MEPPRWPGFELVVPEVVRAKAGVAGANGWIDALPALLAALADEWGFQPVRTLDGGTESYTAEVIRTDGTPAVLKLLVPRTADVAGHEITVLRLADGQGCPRLFDHDAGRGALLMERLGRSLADLDVPMLRRHEILCTAAARLWRPAPGVALPTGADKGRWLVDFVGHTWEALDRPLAEATVAHAIDCAERRIAAHDDERAVLVHGDVHQWNALERGDDFVLVDPDGLLAEAEYDLGVVMREDPEELLVEGPWNRAHRLAARTGLDATAIWEWGVVERVSTGLLCTQIGFEPVGRQMLAAAEAVTGL